MGRKGERQEDEDFQQEDGAWRRIEEAWTRVENVDENERIIGNS
jgi:hypothetical protein